MVQGYYNNYYMMNPGTLDSYLNTNLMSPYNNFNFCGGTGMNNWGYSPEQMADLNKRSIDSNAEVNKVNAKAYNKNLVTNSIYGLNTQIVEDQMSIFQSSVLGNRQENVPIEYDKLYKTAQQMFKDAGYEPTDAEIKTYIDKTYLTATGESISSDIKKNSHSSFTHGFIQGASFGFLEQKSADENIEKITGEAQTNGSKAATWAGRILGGAVALVTIPLALAGIGVGLKKAVPAYGQLLGKAFKAVAH